MLMLAADSERGEATDFTTGVRLDDVFIDGANALATSLDEGLCYALVGWACGVAVTCTLRRWRRQPARPPMPWVSAPETARSS